MNLRVRADDWDALLQDNGCDDAYYLRGFIESAATALGGDPVFLRHEDEGGAVIFPCIVRDVPEGRGRDVTTLAYGGPLALGPSPPVGRFYERYEDWCTLEEIVSTFLRFHPLFANQRFGGGSFRLEQIEGSVSWPLEGDLFSGMHPHHRRLVRKARAAGLEVTGAGPEALERFAGVYDETMRRVGASSLYFFPDEYWVELARLGDRLVCLEARREGRLFAGVLCLATPPWLHYHLGATTDEGRGIGASHLLLYSAACLGQKDGYEQFHLGSGVGGDGGSLLEFKRRFSPGPLLEQWFGKAVHDRDRYLELSGASELVYEGFFPAYRRS